jgi:hypothetical protein
MQKTQFVSQAVSFKSLKVAMETQLAFVYKKLSMIAIFCTGSDLLLFNSLIVSHFQSIPLALSWSLFRQCTN